jgi:hypothetical protein
MRVRRSLLGLAAAVLVAGCSLLPLGRDVSLVFENSSTLEIGIRVNGKDLDPAPAGASGGRAIPAGGFPWHIEAVTPGGRVIASMDLVAAPTCVPAGDDGMACDGAIALVDMVCGRFAMWATGTVPSFPAPVPGVGEPCGP